MKILGELKTLLEVDIEETIFDSQLLLYVNSGIGYLTNNGIPVSRIDENATKESFVFMAESDYAVLISWLHLYCLQRFDRTLMTQGSQTTLNWIDSEMTNLLYQLKVKYDRSDLDEV